MSTVFKSLFNRTAHLQNLKSTKFCRLSSTKTEPCVYDLTIVGGGIIGCSTAREMIIRHPKMKIALVEKEPCLAMHQSGHNSGVVHAGIYYKPGSIKAKLCVEGMYSAYDYFCKKDITHEKVGKLIVAQTCEQVTTLEKLYENALKNKVPDVELVNKECIKNYQANVTGEKAIWSPWTGIVDWAEVTQHFAEDFKECGGHVYLNFKVTGFSSIVSSPDEKSTANPCPISVESKERSISTKFVLTCAGLYSDRLAVLTGGDKNPRIIPVRGEYLMMNEKGKKKNLLCANIYPVPDGSLPFLGVHFTPRINGDIWIGPNAVIALSREGYRWRDINVRDCVDMMKFPGFWKLVYKYFRPGMNEILNSFITSRTIKECQKYICELKASDVKRGCSGVRAQALENDGTFVDEFVFDASPGLFKNKVLHVRNAPSPGATSSMAIAKHICSKLENDFHLGKAC